MLTYVSLEFGNRPPPPPPCALGGGGGCRKHSENERAGATSFHRAAGGGLRPSILLHSKAASTVYSTLSLCFNLLLLYDVMILSLSCILANCAFILGQFQPGRLLKLR
jgi:hypothetical protein